MNLIEMRAVAKEIIEPMAICRSMEEEKSGSALYIS